MATPYCMKLPGLEPLALNSILYLKAEGNYTRVHFVNLHTPVAVSPICLKGIDGKYDQLIRIHNSYLANKQYIIKVLPLRGRTTGVVRLLGGVELPIAKRRYSYVQELIATTMEGAWP